MKNKVAAEKKARTDNVCKDVEMRNEVEGI